MTTKLDSPALKSQSENYPPSWHKRVPSRIRMDKTVLSDLPFHRSRYRAVLGKEYDAYVNSQGAVCAIFDNGEMLGLKPYEFTVIAWHGDVDNLLENPFLKVHELIEKLEGGIGNGAKVYFSTGFRCLIVQADWSANFHFQAQLSIATLENDPELLNHIVTEAQLAYENKQRSQHRETNQKHSIHRGG